MAHNLEIRNGKTSFAAKGERAWHGLGTYVKDAMTAQQVIELANMDWTVEKRELFQQSSDGFYSIPSHMAVVRTDTNDTLGVVSKSYTPVQNRDCFGFFDSIIDRDEAIYETAGVLGKGERIFITAKLPDDIRVNDEIVESYILLTNGHDGMNAIKAGFTSVRVVCNNTLTAALKGLKGGISFRHTTNVKDMLSDAARIMGISSVYAKQLEQEFNRMSKVKISDDLLRKFIEDVMMPRKEQLAGIDKKEFSTRFTNTVDSIFDFAKNDPTQLTNEANGTVWGAYNAISGYYGHIKEYSDATQRMGTIVYGTGHDNVKKAYELATSII
jgi:phage/plasmid-like protein (TIGR03299 family)